MARHTFRLQDVTGDNRILARSAYGYDWNYLVDGESMDFGNSQDVRLMFDDPDVSNPSFIIALDDTSQQMHITDVGAIATDWNVSAGTHPTLYIHSNTTPSTDYLRIGTHDGTTAYIDVVGGTTLALQIAGTSAMTVTSTGMTYADDQLLGIGTGNTARFSWDTTDANANELLLQMPAGGGTDVPVLVIGIAVESVDLGMFNGVVDPRVALLAAGAVTTGSVLEFRKARGSITSPTVVTTGDDMGTIDFYGAVAAGEYVRGASIRADMTGTVATTRGPGNLSFNVATDAAPSVLTERLLITASGAMTMTPETDVIHANATGVIIGYTAQVAVGGVLSELELLGTAPADSTMSLTAWSADAVPPRLYFGKSRSATIGTFGIITTGDNLGEILAFGDDGVDFNSNGNASCAIIFDSAGTIAADRVPGQILIQTATDAQPSVLTTAITISPAQVTTFAGTVAVGANSITCTGSLSATGSRLTKWWATDGTSTNALTVDSSETVKHDIAPYMGDALNIVRNMDVITFKHNAWLDASNRTKLGLRAESVMEPLIVSQIEHPEGGSYPGVNTYGLETLLTKAVQQLAEKVDRLEARGRR